MTKSNPKLGEVQRLVLLHTLFLLEWAEEIKAQGKYPGRLIWGRDRVKVSILRDRIFWIDDDGHVTPSIRATLSRSLRQLESRGFIVRWNDLHSEPEYTTHISLTEQGRKMVGILQARRENVNKS